MRNFLISFATALISITFGCNKSEELNINSGFNTVEIYDDTLASILNSSLNIASGSDRIYMTYGVGNSNSFMIAGSLLFYPKGYFANLMALDNSGALLWEKALPKEVVIDDILTLDDGSCMAAGFKYKTGTAAYIYLYRFDVNGNSMINDSIQLSLPSGEIFAYSGNEANSIYLKQCLNGNLLIYGSFNSTNSLNGFASEYDLNLQSVWVKKYSTAPGSTSLKACIQTNDGGYIFAGDRILNNQSGNGSIILIKTNSVGDTLWTKSFAGQEMALCNDFVTASNGNYLLSFYTEANNTMETYIYELSVNGDSLNASTINSSMQLYNAALLPQDGGGVFALMNSKRPPIFDSGTPLVKFSSSSVSLDASLQLINNKNIQTHSVNYYPDACKTSDGKIALAGLVQLSGRNYYNPSLLIFK